jgi:hypothetical protein
MRGGAQICTYVRLIRARFIPSPSLYDVFWTNGPGPHVLNLEDVVHWSRGTSMCAILTFHCEKSFLINQKLTKNKFSH